MAVATFLEKMGFTVHIICHRGDGWRSPSKWVSALRISLPQVLPRLRTHFTIVATNSGHGDRAV